MRTALWTAAFTTCLALGCKDQAPPAPKVTPRTLDAAVAVAPRDAAAPTGPTGDAGPGPLTPAVGARGVQIVDLQYGGYAQPGLPAIKDDGSEVLVTALLDDGGRGYLDLYFRVLDGATGHVEHDLHLADASETSAAETADDKAGNFDLETALATKVRERVAQANARIAGGSYRSLVTVMRAELGLPSPTESLVTGDLTFTYDLGHRRLTVTRAGKPVASHDLRAELPTARPPAGSPCPGDLPYLRALHVDPPSKKVVVELGAFAQGHNCGSNGPTYVIVPLP